MRKIRSMVEMGVHEDVEFYELPEGWDSWSPERQERKLIEIAIEHQNNAAPCGAEVVEVDD